MSLFMLSSEIAYRPRQKHRRGWSPCLRFSFASIEFKFYIPFRIKTMKVRLRSLESKETLKIEVPNSCSVQQLKETLSRTISSSSSSSSLYLSLNRKDEINASSPHQSLHSIGITSGDLIFYTVNPNAFSLETLIHKPTPQETDSRDSPMGQNSAETGINEAPSIPEPEKTQTLEYAEPESMDMGDGPVEEVEVVVEKSNSEPSLMKRVLMEALGNDVTDFKLLVLAVHAVILESGFVRVDLVSGMAVGNSHLLDEWPSTASAISLRYTLPEILTNVSCASPNTALLKFQSLGHVVNVYGSLSDFGSGLHRVCISKSKFARALELMMKNSESKGSSNDGGDDHHQNKVFELWKMVKDGLALPLLIDLCDKARLDPPPCFMRLPMDLKLMILEYLPGVDVAKVACVCKELQYLSSRTELWKQKYEEEFGPAGSGIQLFKVLFALHWGRKKKLERQVPFRGLQPRHIRFFPRIRDPQSFGIPSIVGGDYDLLPGFGRPFPLLPPRRTFSPRCNLGGFNN